MTTNSSSTTQCLTLAALPGELKALPPELQEGEGLVLALSSALPWAISVVLHVGLFLILFFAVATFIRTPLPGTNDAGVQFLPPPLQHPSKTPEKADTPQEATQNLYPNWLQDGFAKVAGDGVDEYVGINPQDNGCNGLQSIILNGKSRIIGIGGDGNGAHGKGGRLPKFNPGSPTKFVGIQDYGHNICYVIDRSGSMLETFDFLKAEMARSINRMQANQNFHVIFFADGAPMENPPKKLVSATPAHKQQALDFLRDVVPSGQTNPTRAMERAFQVTTDPDKDGKVEKVQLVYLLTDGEFPADCVKRIRQLNTERKVRINTISFIYDTGRAQLETIAGDSGGKFKFVTQEMLDDMGK